MKNYKNYGMQMWNEDDGLDLTGGSGGGEEETQQKVEEKPSTVQLDPAAFDKFGEVIARQFKQQDDSRQQLQQNRQPTAEERAAARKQFGMVDIDDETLSALDNLETRKGTWQKLVDRIYESQGNINAAQLAQLNKVWEERFAPVSQMLTAREESERVSRFHSKYPQLASEEMAPVLSGIGQKLAEQGAFKGLTESQAFDKLAQGVESVIKHHNPQFSLTKTSGKSTNEIPIETSGSRGGGGQAMQGAKPGSPNDLFGPVRTKK